MTRLFIALCLTLVFAWSPLAARAAEGDAYAKAGPHPVAVIEGEWRDPARDRTVPYLIRYPADLAARAPIVIFSHGLGGSRRGAAYYGDHLASHGYVVVFVQHPGSDIGIWQGKILDREVARASINPKSTLDRFFDIPFAVGRIRAMDAAPGPLQGHLDLARMGMSGHSFGAVTTQAMAGQVYPMGRSLPEPAFKAFLAMSPSPDRDGDNARAFGAIDRPFLLLTGTKDDLVLGPGAGNLAVDRVKPYEFLGQGPVTQMILTGGDHMVFSGRFGPGRPMDERFHTLVDAAATAFWDGYLKDDPAARAWLRDGGLARLAGADAAVMSKGPAVGK